MREDNLRNWKVKVKKKLVKEQDREEKREKGRLNTKECEGRG